MAGLATTFGSGAMTNSINEIEHSQVILVVGSNTTEAHPQVARRIFSALERGARLVVVDPRRTEIAARAHVHLQLRPGTDIPLLNAMMRVILDENLEDDVFIEMRTENFLALRNMLHRLDLEATAATAGVPLELIRAAARLYAEAQKGVICYCLGVTQHVTGTDNVQTIANLAMLTGNLEKEFTGVDPLRGQNNVQGACDMGALPGVFPSYQSVTVLEHREKFERAWGVKLPDKPGLSLTDMTHAGPGGPLKGMFVMGENPVLSDPSIEKVRETLANLEFLAVADIFLTETAELAHVVFPAASFAEKTGTFTNSERRVQMVRQAIPPLSGCRTDSDILCELSRRMGYVMHYDSAAEIMEEIALLAPIYGGMHHDRLEKTWGLQWPCWDRSHPGTPFLHRYFFTRGRGRFMPAGHREPAEPVSENFPLTLMTGRVYHHYHTGTMTRKGELLGRECPAPLLEINPTDAAARAIRNGDRVRLSSPRGAIELIARLTERVAVGSVYTDFHFSEAPVNLLTVGDRDPQSKCPELKVCAAELEKATP